MKRILLILFCSLHSILFLRSQNASSDIIFKQFFDNAVAFADTYPREKVYLHFDNSSYYVGDTIWFKAYTVYAENNMPSTISKPLYVEMLDQTGHITQRQIIELNSGEGHGQIILNESTMSGYYEIRAYTRWMLAFSEPSYFSRTFPIYQSAQEERPERRISTYNLNPSMKQRPKNVTDKLAIQFFPEGGTLVKGISSRVAFKAESREDGNVILEGAIYTKDGEKLTEIKTLHDGMGIFTYTPEEKPAVAKVTYKEKEYKFNLPDALSAGYVLNVNNSSGAIVGNVLSNENTPDADIVAFISHEGRTYSYWILRMRSGGNQTFLLKTRDLPGGIYQVSLLDKTGNMLCERFTFVQPNKLNSIQLNGIKDIYRPFEPIRCEIQVTDQKGNPLQGSLSISVRDAIRSDYAEYDNNIFTDMLLTSGLKGYIDKPGYYFADITLRKLQELDVLLMVHGWRQYDLSQLISGKNEKLLQQSAEKELLLQGQIRSSLLKKEMKDMEVSVMAKVDNTFVAGNTFTDENGKFQLPVTSFEGEVEAVFQIRRRGSKHKKDASVMLDRNFAPTPRAFSYEEEHPQWMDKNSWITLSNRIDSLYVDSISKTNNTYLLSEVEIAKKRKNKNITTQVFEKSVDAYYDVTRLVDELRDQGIVINTIPDLLSKVNPNFSYDVQDGSSRYKEKTICLIVGKQVLDTLTAWTLWNEIDGIKQIMICEGSNSYTNEVLNSIHGSNMTKGQNVKDMMTAMNPPRTFDDSFYLYGDAAKKKISLDDTEKAKSEPLFRKKSSGINNNVNVNIDFSRFGQYALFYITPHFDSNYSRLTQKSMKAAHGTRRTIIQGYSRPLAFYSPVYKDKIPTANVNHRRRTLYWNPTIQTDKNGKISIECQNGMYANPVIIHAEMLKGGIPCSITIIGEKKKK